MPYEFSQQQKEKKEFIQLPSTLTELEESTSSAFLFGDKYLGLWTADGTELSTIAYEEWVDITSDLDEIFFELNNGILGTQILTFASLADAELVHENIRREIESLLAQTAPLAKRMNPLIDRLCAVNPTMTRADIIATLCEGEILATETLDYTSKQPHRKSLLGILHDLGERLNALATATPSNSPLAGGGPDGTSTLWSFENSKTQDLTPVVVLSDPFSNDAESLTYWSERGGESILKRSEQKTQSIIYELENLRQTMEGNGEKRNVMGALAVIESWLESNMILYRDGKEVDFELYHLGMEEPQEVDAIFGSLDIIKHDNPEFFVQLMGINPAGGKSPYFGSFIHKALFNTQKTLDDIVTEAPNLVLKASMKQLLRIDGHVQRWNFHETISEESLRALAQAREAQESSAKTPEEKAQIRLFWQAILTKPTIELAVKRQLEAMKEVNFKELKSELLAKLDDHEHPMLVLKAISTLPLVAFRDEEIKKRLTEIFGEKVVKDPGDLREWCGKGERTVTKAMFDRIPVFDYENARVGKFFSIVTQEAMAREKKKGIVKRALGREDFETDGKMFLYEMLQSRVMTPALVKAGLSNDAQVKFFTAMDDKHRVAEIMGNSFLGRDADPDTLALFSRDGLIPSCDRALYAALTNHWNWNTEKRKIEREKKTEPRDRLTDDEFDFERDTCIAFVTLGQGDRAKELMDKFDSFRLRKKDAKRVTEVIFSHLKESVGSSQCFEFLLKHAEKFEEEDCSKLLRSLPKEVELLEHILRTCRKEYPPAFEKYFIFIVEGETWEVSKRNASIAEAIKHLLGIFNIFKAEDEKENNSKWSEEHIINFARIPAFVKRFVEHAKEIFERYPDLPVRLYGEWGARMVKEFDLTGKNKSLLPKMLEFCPKDASDNPQGRFKVLQEMLEATRPRYDGEELSPRMVEHHRAVEGIVRSFEKEFPEATSGDYQEMRNLFGEQFLGFTEVEQAFANKSGKQWMVIGEEERKKALEELAGKFYEPEMVRFLEHAQKNPNREKDIALIYRVDIGARPEEERKRITAFLPAEHLTPGWHFIRLSEPEGRKPDDRMYDDFVLNREYSLQDKDSARGRFSLV